MNKFKELINKLKNEYMKLSPMTREVIETVVFVVVMVIIIRFFIGEIRWIPSTSMSPTLINGDRIVVERFSRFYKKPERGDVMVFYPPFEKLQNTPWRVFSRLTGFFCKDIAYIKRVIGLPGDKFEIKTDKDGISTVFINDEPLDEKYICSENYAERCDERGNIDSHIDTQKKECTDEMICGPIIIPEHQYLMMGDNRGNSFDGRWWGFLPEDRFIGRAVFLFWPLNRIKTF